MIAPSDYQRRYQSVDVPDLVEKEGRRREVRKGFVDDVAEQFPLAIVTAAAVVGMTLGWIVKRGFRHS